MQAAVLRAFGAPLVIEDLTLALPAHGQIAVRLAACAICHSDIAYADGAYGGTLPMVLGHEASGFVTALGEGVTGFAEGDPVLVTLIRACGTCPACASEAPTSCDHAFDAPTSPLRAGNEVIGQAMSTAGFAEAVVVSAGQCVKLPVGIDMAVACLLACGVITGYGAVINTARLRSGQTCAVIGVGGVGLNAIQAAAIAGARTIVALDLKDEKLAIARSFGATHTFRADAPDSTALVRDATAGRGVDFAFVTVGVPSAYEFATELLAPGGAMVMVGMPPTTAKVSYAPTMIAAMNQSLLGSRMGQTVLARDIPVLLALYKAGALELDALVSNRYPLARINEAIANTRAGTALRNVIVF